jgi:hypothetical protein
MNKFRTYELAKSLYQQCKHQLSPQAEVRLRYPKSDFRPNRVTSSKTVKTGPVKCAWLKSCLYL